MFRLYLALVKSNNVVSEASQRNMKRPELSPDTLLARTVVVPALAIKFAVHPVELIERFCLCLTIEKANVVPPITFNSLCSMLVIVPL